MRSSDRTLRAFGAAIATAACALASSARAEPQAGGFALERFSPAPAGGGWLAMDALDMHGGLGGAAALTTSWAHDPLRIGTLAVVADQAFVEYGFAATYDRFRLSLAFDQPLYVKGDSGSAGGYAFTAPDLDLGTNPDTLSDAKIGLDARLFGDARGAFRLGLGARLFVPNHHRSDYVTDETYRALFRVPFAGDVGRFTYAGFVGVHVRPLDDAPTPQSPRGSELPFGIGAGVRVPMGDRVGEVIVGAELFGATAFASFLGSSTTAAEALVSARWEQAGEGPHLRVKLGVGGGLHPEFGAPEWRAVLGVEVFQFGR